jgi:predicted nucleotidyltransferase
MPGPSKETRLLNPDYRDILSIFNEEKVEYMVVGAYALAYHGVPRATGDIDIWIRRSDENAERVWRALSRFGVPLYDLTKEDLKTPETVFQIGIAPRRIDILTSIDGVEFEEAEAERRQVEIEGIRVQIIGRKHLLQNKKATGRLQDQADIERLEGGQK